MIDKKKVLQIKKELATTDIPFSDIARKHLVSKATVNNINVGKSHKDEDTQYPLRQYVNNYFLDNEVAFIRKLAAEGYSAKQIHIIVTKGSYSTISNIVGFKTRQGVTEYEYDEDLEHRREVFDFIATPHEELVNEYTDMITLEDAIYIKLLGRFMAPLLTTIEIFLPVIESSMVGFDFKLRNREDIARYLEWGGTAFNTIWWIKNIYINKITRVGDEPIHYNDFPINRFLEVDEDADLLTIREMIEFDTKENYRKSE